MVGCIVGPAAGVLVGVPEPLPVLDPPHAASSAAGKSSAMPARREKLTVRPMCDPRFASGLNRFAIVDRDLSPCPPE
jgi:hypothetical protein